MIRLDTVCVFCGSSSGDKSSYRRAAENLGRSLATAGIDLVFGGGDVGLMGAVSVAARDAGGRVTGIIPERIAAMVPVQPGIHMETVTGMHARKARMYELADGFIALPGGIGTLDELFESWTWTQLGYHNKPVGLLDVDGFFDELIAFLDTITHSGFLKPAHRSGLVSAKDPQELLTAMKSWTPAAEPKLS